MLIQDDFGLQPLDNGSRMHLMDIIEDQYGKKSTLITSQLPVKDRYDVIGKKTIAGAVMNRITHLAVRIELHGESIRKICGKKWMTILAVNKNYKPSTNRKLINWLCDVFLYFRKNKSGGNLSWILGICFIRVSKLSLYSLNTLYNVLKVSSFPW